MKLAAATLVMLAVTPALANRSLGPRVIPTACVAGAIAPNCEVPHLPFTFTAGPKGSVCRFDARLDLVVSLSGERQNFATRGDRWPGSADGRRFALIFSGEHVSLTSVSAQPTGGTVRCMDFSK